MFHSLKAEVKTYYDSHNEILERFARSLDTTMYLQEMHSLIELNGKFYVDLTHHYTFMDLCLDQGNYELATLIVKQQLKHSLIEHTAFKNMDESDSTKKGQFFHSDAIQKLLSDAEPYFVDHFANFDMSKSLQITSLHEIDQFGRTVTGLKSIDTVQHITSDIIKYIDSTNLVKLYEYIQEHGFPKQEEVGYFADYFILWHTYCRPCGHTYTLPNGQWYYDYLDSVYYEAVKDGLYRNVSYAYMKDKSMNQQGAEHFENCERKGQKYVTWFQGKISEDLYDAKNIDKHRAEIYLPPYWVDAVLNGWKIPKDYPLPDNVPLKY